MVDNPGAQEQLGPEARLQTELAKLESEKRDVWVLIVFAAAVLILGVASFLMPGSFWTNNTLEIRMAPQVLFVGMLVVMLVALYMARREVDLRKLRLANLQQSLTARSDHSASLIDTLTKVFNRSFLHDLLQGEISRSERNNRPLTLIMCDVNNFKQVNDRYGHLMGDYVLAQVAGILRSCVRGSDYVVRYGGDEFLIILSETDEVGGQIVRRRIHQKVGEWDSTNRLGEVPISVSLGLYQHVPGQSGEQDVAEADARMYAEKQAGTGKVVTGNANPRRVQ